MRGTVIQYNGNDGKGIVSAEGQQFNFAIQDWRGEVAPIVNGVVDVDLANNEVKRLSPVPDDVLMKEKANDLANRLGAVGGSLGASGAELGKNVLTRIGTPAAMAYATFLISSLGFGFVTIRFFGEHSVTLFNLADSLSGMGLGGSGKFWLVLSYLTLFVPVFWKDKRAWLAFLIPALVLLKMGWDVYSAYSGATAQMGAFFGGGASRQMSNAVTFGLGFYLCLASSGFLAWSGFRKYSTQA